MTTFAIRHRETGATLFSCELPADVAEADYATRLGFAVKAAIAAGANLTATNLTGAELTGANLVRAYLTDAALTGAELTGADFTSSNLGRANLAGATLTNAYLAGANLAATNLTNADLTNADLTDANFTGAILTGAILHGATLSRADLRYAYLTPIKNDFLAEVLRLPFELEALRAALIEGHIDGSSYNGDCACLAGTLAHAHGVALVYDGYMVGDGITAFSVGSDSPRECWFLGIKKGDTPETNQVSAICLAWTNEAIAIRDMILRGPK